MSANEKKPRPTRIPRRLGRTKGGRLWSMSNSLGTQSITDAMHQTLNYQSPDQLERSQKTPSVMYSHFAGVRQSWAIAICGGQSNCLPPWSTRPAVNAVNTVNPVNTVQKPHGASKELIKSFDAGFS